MLVGVVQSGDQLRFYQGLYQRWNGLGRVDFAQGFYRSLPDTRVFILKHGNERPNSLDIFAPSQQYYSFVTDRWVGIRELGDTSVQKIPGNRVVLRTDIGIWWRIVLFPWSSLLRTQFNGILDSVFELRYAAGKAENFLSRRIHIAFSDGVATIRAD
jgi:hypothetical protein